MLPKIFTLQYSVKCNTPKTMKTDKLTYMGNTDMSQPSLICMQKGDKRMLMLVFWDPKKRTVAKEIRKLSAKLMKKCHS